MDIGLTAIGAGLAIGLAAIGTGLAQGRIGAAGAGVIAEKPESLGMVILLIAIPLLIQVYFNSSLAYGLARWFKVPYAVAAPGALIGASNFFELAVATAISLFGLTSGATLATVVGVLVEVPVMLSVCAFCNRTRRWFPAVSDA